MVNGGWVCGDEDLGAWFLVTAWREGPGRGGLRAKGQKQLGERAVTQGPSPSGNRRCREGSSAQRLPESLGEAGVRQCAL